MNKRKKLARQRKERSVAQMFLAELVARQTERFYRAFGIKPPKEMGK